MYHYSSKTLDKMCVFNPIFSREVYVSTNQRHLQNVTFYDKIRNISSNVVKSR